LKARRLAGVQQPDISLELFGKRWDTPVILAPVGSQKMYHPEGEIAVARAAKSRKYLQILSTMASTAVDEVSSARGEPLWFQLYPTNDWQVTMSLVRRAERAGCPVVAVTVDRPAPRKMEFFLRSARKDPVDCSACHAARPDQRTGSLAERLSRRPNFAGINLAGLNSVQADALTWDFVNRLKDVTSMKVVLKGIVTGEDAGLCLEYGVDGIIVSNHGGRSEASGRSTLESLPEVVSAVQGRIPVIMDGGVRRGTDIFKALALGADAIAIGRPYIGGLAACGQAGVEAALDILAKELEAAMKAHGVRSLGEIRDSYMVDSMNMAG